MLTTPSLHTSRALGVGAMVWATLGCGEQQARTRVDGSRPANPTVVLGTCEEATCNDFPGQPIFQGPVPSNVDALFAQQATPNSGVCLVEPTNGAMLPNNWLPPRIRFVPLPNEDLWEIRLSSRVERNDLVVYTTHTTWTMEREMWNNLALHAGGETVQVSIRGVNSSTRSSPSQTMASFEIAPVPARGTVVYWAADGFYNAGGITKLVGFRMGDRTTLDTLRLSEVSEFPVLNEDGDPKPADELGGQAGRVRCIGCHTATPDGNAVAFVDSWPWSSVMASVTEENLGQRPDYVTEAAARILQQPWQGTPTFSESHWDNDTRIMVQSFGNPEGSGWSVGEQNDSNRDRLVWFDLTFEASLPESGDALNQAVQGLAGQAFGFIERVGDSRGAVNPNWSHDGETIAYVSASETLDGHAGGRPFDSERDIETDIYLVPFDEGRGGQATPLRGASAPGIGEYYPAYSADDRFIAFNRTPSVRGQVYYRPDSEIWVVPAKGGDPKRLRANDPPACTGQLSPGVVNSWPKWSPNVVSANGKAYYWLIFSSARSHPGQFTLPRDMYSPLLTDSSQLYIAAVVAEGDEIIATYPALYLYNQTTNTTNLTPAWADINIPLVDEIQ